MERENTKHIDTVLDEDYKSPERPFSQKELQSLKIKYAYQLKLSREMVYHTKSNYKYYAKRFGNKEKTILENKKNDVEDYNTDIGNCSVSWKIAKTHPRYKEYAKELTSQYMDTHDKERLTHLDVELFRVFYTWLYHEK